PRSRSPKWLPVTACPFPPFTNTDFFSAMLPIPTCPRALMNARSQSEYRQIKRNQDSADKYRHNDEDKRFDHDHGRGQRCLHVLLIEFGHRIQHRRQRAGRFAYFDHFYGQIGENLLLFQTTRQRLSLPNTHRGTLYPVEYLAAAHRGASSFERGNQ